MGGGTYSRYAHADDFCLLADDFQVPFLINLLGVNCKTIRRWRTGAARVPWAAYQLLYEKSKYGLAERDASEGFNRTALLGLVESLKARIASLEDCLERQAKMIDWGCANDSFIDPADPRSHVRPSA
jgi:hypothetical protein